jgi:hypothetical protein
MVFRFMSIPVLGSVETGLPEEAVAIVEAANFVCKP